MKHKHHHHDHEEKKHEYAGMSDSHIAHIVKNHEVDNNLEHRLHSRFAKSFPVGVLAIHVKRCTKLHFYDADLNFTKEDLSIYVRVDVGHQTKCSHIQHCDPRKSFVIMDDIKHFLCEINNYRYCPSNKIVVELIAYEEKEHHKLVGKIELHMFEILKHLYMNETYQLKRGSVVSGEAEIEFCFAYGWFGYGYANQLVNRKHKPDEQIHHSMFFRQEPHDERKLENIIDVASCLPIGHPPFIPFTERVEIGNSARDFDFDIDVHELCRQIDDPILLVKKMRRRMWKLQNQYEQLPTRKERLHYLQKIITPKPDDLLEKRMKKHQESKQQSASDRSGALSPVQDETDQEFRGETPIPITAVRPEPEAKPKSKWDIIRGSRDGSHQSIHSMAQRPRRESIVQRLVRKVNARKHLIPPKIILTPPTPPPID